MSNLESKDVLRTLRQSRGITQEELAERLFVTRQAVSRWESGDTTPNVDTLKALSRLYDVSVNTLLGTPRQMICQCCGMPLEDERMSREPDGAINEAYCQWCYVQGKFAYTDLDELIAFLAQHMANEQWNAEQVEVYLREQLPKLAYWQK